MLRQTAAVSLTLTVSGLTTAPQRAVFEDHSAALAAYAEWISRLEAAGFLRDGTQVFTYGEHWHQGMRRGDQRVSVELVAEG
jgi:hypothetical protein